MGHRAYSKSMLRTTITQSLTLKAITEMQTDEQTDARSRCDNDVQ